MTQEEREIAWDRLTQEEKDELEKRKIELIERSIEKREKARQKIQAEGRWLDGLDGDGRYPELVELSKEYNKGFKEFLDLVEETLEKKLHESTGNT